MPRILIVEDDASVRGLLRRHLSDTYEIVEAGDAAQALAVALEKKPDGILLDLNLPDLSGFELCEMFSKINTTRLTPIIVITAEPAATFRELCLSLGAADYVEKPLDFAKLKGLLATALQSRRSERRREPRVRLSINLKLVGEDAHGVGFVLPVTTNDVSASGFSCMTTAPLEIGTVVQVVLGQGGKDYTAGRATVVRVEHKGTPKQSFGFLLVDKTGPWILQ
jgi:CheY-like chemotaxis protein